VIYFDAKLRLLWYQILNSHFVCDKQFVEIAQV